MKQKVHSVSYLAKAEFELKNGVYDLVALPTGAEVVRVSLAIAGTPKGGNVSVGIKDESKELFLARSITQSSFTSDRDYTATSNKVVMAEVEGSNDDTKCVLRVLYFLPSVIEVEY
ncbi:hypothetical protein CHC165_14830 [Helicobacter pylori]